MALTLACGVGISAGIEMAIATGYHTRLVLLNRMNFADLEVQFLPEDVANLPDLTNIPGVRAVERRLVLPGEVLLGGNRRIVGALILLEATSPRINSFEFLEGAPIRPDNPESAVIERSLAHYHDIRVRDRVRMRVGETVYESRVDGIAVSPEYLFTTTNPDYVIPEKGAFGVVFGNLARVSNSLGFTMVNDLVFDFQPGADHRAVEQAVMDRLGRLNLERVIPREEHFVWRSLQLQLEAFELYTPAIVITLGLLAFILSVITVNRLVLDQRREIGVLFALGHRAGQVVRAYSTVGAFIGGVGALIGILLAFFIRNLFAGIMQHALGVPYVVYVTAPILLAGGFVAGVLTSAAATALPVFWMCRRSPQRIIRKPPAEAFRLYGSTWWASRWLAILPIPVRFGLRNMFRQPGRTLAMVSAMAGSLGVAAAYVVATTSNFETIEIAFGRERWDLAVDFLYPVFIEDLAPVHSLPGVRRIEPYFQRFAEVGANGRYEGARILGLHPGSDMKGTTLRKGRALSGAPDEIILSQDLARRLRLEIADRATVKIRRGQEFPFHVVGISGDIVLGQALIPFGAAQAVTDFKDEATGAYIETSGTTADVAAALVGLPYVAKVTTKDTLATSFRQLMSGVMQIVYVDTLVSVFVGALFVFSSVNLSIAERQGEYATLRCLGYGGRQIGAIILTEALGLGGLAALLSVPLGMVLAQFLNARMSEAWYEVITIFRPGDFGVVVTLAIALVPVAAYPGFRMVQALDIAGALRTKTIE